MNVVSTRFFIEHQLAIILLPCLKNIDYKFAVVY